MLYLASAAPVKGGAGSLEISSAAKRRLRDYRDQGKEKHTPEIGHEVENGCCVGHAGARFVHKSTWAALGTV